MSLYGRDAEPIFELWAEMTVSFTGFSRYRDMASELFLCQRARSISEFRWYHGLVDSSP